MPTPGDSGEKPVSGSTAWESYLEIFIQVLIFYSIGMQLIELEFADVGHSTGFFLWSERVVAAIFTIEYLARWRASGRWNYVFEFSAIVDLIAVIPFYVGFFVDLRSLRLIRLLRVLRLFKLTRYNDALQHILNAYYKVRYEFTLIGFALFFVGWCSSLAIFELEREEHPETFGRLSDAVWYILVTVTTVGYGDKVPSTMAGKVVAGCTMIAGLALFGTFMSLIGSAYLDEIRRSMEAGEGKEKGSPEGPSKVDFPPTEVGSTSEENAAACDFGPASADVPFDPRRVLQAIDSGEFDQSRGLVHLETVRLLAAACRRLVAGDPRPDAV